jgi:hypothetical protein
VTQDPADNKFLECADDGQPAAFSEILEENQGDHVPRVHQHCGSAPRPMKILRHRESGYNRTSFKANDTWPAVWYKPFDCKEKASSESCHQRSGHMPGVRAAGSLRPRACPIRPHHGCRHGRV